MKRKIMLSAFDVQTANQSITQSFMDFKHTQNKRFALPDSLQWRINLALAVIALLAASATGAWIFADVYRSSKTVQDQTLRQISAYVDASKAAPVFAPNENEERIFVQTEVSSEQDEHFLFLSSKIKDGFSTVFDEDNRSFRIFVRNGERGRVVVMQANEYREQAAKSLALNASLPFIVFIPLMCSLIWWIIRRTMRPVRELSAELETRQSQDLSPLATDGVPSEVGGFVQAINHLLRRTDTLLAQQRRFIADAAHEMRSPFTALSVQAERLAQQDLTPNVQEQVNALQASIQRNRHLLEQLLSLAKAQADGTERVKTELSTQKLFRLVLQDLLPLAWQKQQDLGVVSEDDIVFFADETELYTLLKTLADNAIRYTPAGGQIDLRWRESADEIVLYVEDNGIGIAAEERSRVLEPFYRILGSGEQGTGLGLSIADNIAKRYGGGLQLKDSETFEQGLLIEVHLAKESLKSV